MPTDGKSLDELFDLSAEAVVYWDVETCSRCDLTECGAYVYAADPSTGMLVIATPSAMARCRCGSPAIRRRDRSPIRPGTGLSRTTGRPRTRSSRTYSFPSTASRQFRFRDRTARSDARS